jgi:AraC-like DNA-binding protein
MKQRKETRVTNAFTVDSIVTVYHFRVPDVEQDSDTEGRDVSYDFWQLYYVEQGMYVCRIDGKELSLGAGQLLFCEPDRVRTTLRQQDALVGIISFRCSSDRMGLMKNMPLTLSVEMEQDLRGLLKAGTDMFTAVSDQQLFMGQELREGTSDHKLQMLKNRLELLLIEIYESTGKEAGTAEISQNQKNYYARQFAAITVFLKNNLHRNVTVSEICAYTNLSENTVKRICRHAAGCGVIHYFLTLKIEKAKQMLCRTDKNITQISECLGFSGVHYFSRLFKRLTGMSPRQYARKEIQ